jgi:hypothetical protein
MLAAVANHIIQLTVIFSLKWVNFSEFLRKYKKVVELWLFKVDLHQNRWT